MGTLDRLVREEAWAPLSADLPVLRSSNELVEALKREMRDCVSRVTRGPALLDLAAVFQVCQVDGRLGRVQGVVACGCSKRMPARWAALG